MSLANKQQGKRKRLNRNKPKNFKKIDVSAEEKVLADVGQKPEKKVSDILVSEEKVLTKFEKARSKVSHIDKILSSKPAADLRKARVVNTRTDLRKVKKNMHMKKPKVTASFAGKKDSAKAGAFYDLWSSSAPDDGRDTSELVADKLFKRNKVATQTLKVNGQHKKPKHMFKGPSSVCKSSVVAPHAGSSYNPDAEAHRELLDVEILRELQKQEKEEKLVRATQIDPSRYVTVADREKEDLEGLCSEEEADDQDEQEEISELPILSNVTVPKTRQKRRREKLQKDMQRELKDAKAKRVRDNEVFRTKTLIKEINNKKAANKETSDAKRAIKAAKMPQLSYMKFEEPDQDLLLPEELPDSLRKLKPEGDLMTDQYKSYQRRCIVEARKKFRPKKRTGGKVKFQEKRDFRGITL